MLTTRALLASVLALALSLLGPTAAEARGSHGSSGSHGSAKSGSSTVVARDARGRIQRSAAARHVFARQTGDPNGRPGYVIDHIIPLACGGADKPSNMQWQTIAAGKAKDKVERVGCR